MTLPTRPSTSKVTSPKVTITMRMTREKAECLWDNCDHHAVESDSKLVRDSHAIAARAINKALSSPTS